MKYADWYDLEESFRSEILKRICYNSYKIQQEINFITSLCEKNMLPPMKSFVKVHSLSEMVLRDLKSICERPLSKQEKERFDRFFEALMGPMFKSFEEVKKYAQWDRPGTIKAIPLILDGYLNFLHSIVYGSLLEVKELITEDIEKKIISNVIYTRAGIEVKQPIKKEGDKGGPAEEAEIQKEIPKGP